MDFETWWESAKAAGHVPMWDSNKHSARLAWEAATNAERDACAKTCEEEAEADVRMSGGAWACAERIRAR